MTMEPIRVAVTVPRTPDEAFELFTARIAEWWPMRTHSIGEDRAADVVIESEPGGRMYEVLDDGSRHEWGIVELCEPPRRVLVRWRVNQQMPDYTEWEASFEEAGEGFTRVTLEHRGWERLLEHAERSRESYATGWPVVMDVYAEHVGSLV